MDSQRCQFTFMLFAFLRIFASLSKTVWCWFWFLFRYIVLRSFYCKLTYCTTNGYGFRSFAFGNINHMKYVKRNNRFIQPKYWTKFIRFQTGFIKCSTWYANNRWCMQLATKEVDWWLNDKVCSGTWKVWNHNRIEKVPSGIQTLHTAIVMVTANLTIRKQLMRAVRWQIMKLAI